MRLELSFQGVMSDTQYDLIVEKVKLLEASSLYASTHFHNGMDTTMLLQDFAQSVGSRWAFSRKTLGNAEKNVFLHEGHHHTAHLNGWNKFLESARRSSWKT